MTGTLQIGATVNDGEQFAINKLAEWVTTSVRSSSDSKVAIKRCLKTQYSTHIAPGLVHLPSAERAASALVNQRSSRCGPALPKIWTGELVDVGHQLRGGYGTQPQER